MLLSFLKLQKIYVVEFICVKICTFTICMHGNILKPIFQVYLIYLGIILYFDIEYNRKNIFSSWKI